jgi:hypothetical protein
MFVAPGTVGQCLTHAVAEGLASNWWRLLLNGIVQRWKRGDYAGSGSVAVMTVPSPAGLWTLSLPPRALTLSAIPTRP